MTRAQLEANIRTFYVYRFLANVHLWLPIWVLYLQRERGLSLAQVTALDAPFWLIVVLAQMPTGAFADRWGRRTSIIVGGALFAAALIVFGVAQSYPVILLSYAMWALSMAFQQGADMALLYDNLAALDRVKDYQREAGRAFGLQAAAAVLAMLIGAKLADATRLDVPILVSAAIALLAAAVAFSFREPPHASRPPGGLMQTMWHAGAVAWRDPRLRYMLAFSCVVQAVSIAPTIFVQPFLARHAVPVGIYGLLQAPARLCAIVAALYGFRLVNRIGEGHALLALPVWLCGCLLLLAAWDQPYAFVAIPLFALGFSGANPLLSDYLNRYIPANRRATVLSLAQLGSSVLLAVLEPLLGAVAQSRGLTSAFGVAALFIAIGGALTLLPWLRTVRRMEKQATAAAPTPDTVQ